MIFVMALLAYFALLVRSRDLPTSVSWWRRNAYALAFAVAAAVPLLPTMFFATSFDRGIARMVNEDGNFVAIPSSQWPFAIDWITVLLAWWLVLAQALQYMRAKKLIRNFDHLEPVADGELARRIGEMAAKLGLRTPRIMLSRNSSLLVNAGAVDGLLPTVIVGDGVLHEMPQQERDAVLAHELGHLASRLGMKRIALAVAVATATAFASGLMPTVVSGVFLLAVWFTAETARSYQEEFAADRLGAKIIGGDLMAGALHRIVHSNYGGTHGPWLTALLTHPHLAERMARLAPQQVTSAETETARAARRARITLGLLCVLLLGVTLWLGNLTYTAVAMMLAALIAGAPTIALIIAQPWAKLRDVRVLGTRLLHPVARARILFFAITVAAVVLAVAIPGNAGSMLAPISAVALLLAIFWGHSERRLRRQLAQHGATHEWQPWLQLYDAAPARIRHRRDLWFDAFSIAHQARDDKRATAEFEALTNRHPDFLIAHVLRAAQLRGSNPTESVRLLRMVTQQRPGEAYVMGALASALRANQDFDEAWQQVQAAIALQPNIEWLYAITCRIAIARGDLEAARSALAEAEQRDANDLLTLLARTDLAITERRDDAAKLVAECQERALAEPLRNNGPDAEQLAAQLKSQAEQAT